MSDNLKCEECNEPIESGEICIRCKHEAEYNAEQAQQESSFYPR